MPMKTLFRLFLIISLFLLNSNIYAQPESLFLKNKSYFSSTFSVDEIQKLNQAYSLQAEGQKYHIKSDTLYNKAARYLKLQELPLAQNKIKKYQKKEYKYLQKASENKLKALDYSFRANKIIKDVYMAKINSFKPQNNVSLMINLTKYQKDYEDSVLMAKGSTTGASMIDKAFILNDAFYFENKELLFMEYKIGVCNNDNPLTQKLAQKYDLKDDTLLDLPYDYRKDKFLYSPREPKIDEIISYNQQEEDLLIQYFTLGKNGNTDLQKSSEFDPKIKEFDDQIEQETDFMKKRTLISQKKDIVNQQTSLKILAINKYINANTNLYQIRKNHFYDYATTDTISKEYLKIKKFDNKAEVYFNDSKKYLNQANEKGADEKYIALEMANEQIITALKFQENGFNVQIGLDTFIVIPKNIVIQDDKDDDKDGLSNSEELTNGTNPNNLDTDGDGLNDAEEIKHKTNPLLADTDNDGLNDAQEIKKKTNPLLADTDKDGVNDGKDKYPLNPENKPVVVEDNNKDNNNGKNNQPTVYGLWAYSFENPTPYPAYTPPGTIYRVQVGATKYLLPLNELKGYHPIYYETQTGTEVKRFMVGDYTDKTQAQNALNDLKSKGYKDAYIVTFVNGTRTGGVTYSNNQNNNTNNNSNYVASQDITTTKYLIYFVQLGTFSTKKTSAELKNMSKIYHNSLNDGKIQYFVGPYYTYVEAENKLPSVIQNGFTDAVIVAYNNGQKTTIENAKKIEQNSKVSNQVIFRIQVGAFSDYLSDKSLEENFGRLKDVYIINTHIYNGLVIYSVGNAKSFDEAKNLKDKVVQLGYKDCFIISFKGDNQVPLSNVLN